MSTTQVVGFDIDDTITYDPDLFIALAAIHRARGDRIVVVTFREDVQETSEFLRGIGFHDYVQLITSDNPHWPVLSGESLSDWKARVIDAMGITLMYEDMPEVVARLPDHVKVLMPVDCVIRDWMRAKLGLPTS